MAAHVLVINVLSKDSFEECCIKGSVSVPLDELGEYAKNIDQDQKIVVYCASYACPLSRKAWHLLHSMNFKNVYAYEGGIAEWRKKGFATEGDCQAPYLSQEHAKLEEDERIRQIRAEKLQKMMKDGGY